MSETRVIGTQGRKIGGGQRPSAAPPPEPAQPPPRRHRWLVPAVLAVVLAVAAAVLLLRPDDTAAAPEQPEPGITVVVEPRNINLADGHYLRLGFAVQLVAGAPEMSVPQATDIAIALFSGRSVEEVNDPQRRTELQEELITRLSDASDGEVLTVYLTDFVTQ